MVTFPCNIASSHHLPSNCRGTNDFEQKSEGDSQNCAESQNTCMAVYFGGGKNNAKYGLALKEELELWGQADALNCLLLVVLVEEIQNRKAKENVNHGLGSQRNAATFLHAWKENNIQFINAQLGIVNEILWFVDGILFCHQCQRGKHPI